MGNIKGLGLRSPGIDPWRPPFLVAGGAARWVGANLVVIISYFALAYVVSRFFAAYGLFPAPIWLPASVAVVAAMMGGMGLLPGVFIGSLLANAVLFAPPLYVSAIISLTNALGPGAGAAVARRFRPPSGMFTRFSGAFAFILCMTLLSPAISATGGALAVTIEQSLDLAGFYSIWVNWWLTDSGGTLYLAPALILWLGVERTPAMRWQSFGHRDLIVWGVIAVGAALLFATPPLRGSDIRSAFPFLLVVPLSWVALRMSLRAAYTLVSLVSIIAAATTVAGYGPFQDHSIANPLLLVGVLVVLLAANVLTIVALFCEREEAQEASRVKSMFLANMSHELRTPLNAIIGFSELMAGENGERIPAAERADYARTIQASGRHLLSLINNVLDMAKIEAGRLRLNEEEAHIRAVIEEVVRLMRFQAEAKNIAVAVDYGADVRLRIDQRAMRQVLLNLVSNALKFTEDGGRVDIATRRIGNGDLVLEVTDTGTGIAAAELERVFDPFEQASFSGASKVEGTGLGLSICRGLVTLHGGTISLRSQLAKGTTVTVILPAGRIVGVAQA